MGLHKAPLGFAVILFALCLLAPGASFGAASGFVTAPDSFAADEDTQCVDLDLFANDTEGAKSWETYGQVTIVIVTSPSTGTVTPDQDCTGTAALTARYDFPDNVSSAVSFQYRIDDGHGNPSNTSNVDVELRPVIDTLTLTTDTPSAPTAEEGITTSLNVSVTSDDFDGSGSASMDIDSVPASATIACGLCTSVSQAGSTWTLDFDANLSAADITITDTVAATYALPITVNWLDTDGTLTVNGSPAQTGTANVTITVNLPDPPVAVDDSATTPSDNAVIIDVLANDTDPDFDTLTVTATTAPTNGSVVINPDFTITYTPDPGYAGPDSFTYTVSDGGLTDVGTVNVTVTNLPPVAADDSASTNEDVAVLIDVLANDSDPDGDAMMVSAIVTAPANGSVLNSGTDVTYTPSADWNGVDTFVYEVSSLGGTATATVTVTVNAVNDPPTAVDDFMTVDEDSANNTIDPLLNDTDPDGDVPFLVGIATQPANGTATKTGGNLRYTPNPDFFGSDSFTYTLDDGQGLQSTGTVYVTVTPFQDPPVAVDDTVAMDEDTSAVFDVLANDYDVDLDTLTVSAVGTATNGTVTNNGTDVTYTPTLSYVGTDSFTYTVSDGNGNTAQATVNVTINNVNDPPVATDDSASTNEDVAVIIDVLINDSDIDGDPMSITAAGGATNGSVVVNGDNTVTYTPNANFFGVDTFTYTVSDPSLTTDTGTVTVTVNAVNDAPLATDDSAVTDEELAVTITVLANDSDVEGDPLSVSAVSAASNGAVVINGDNTVTYTPNLDFFGADSFTYTVDDGNGGSMVATVNITVNNINDAPVAADDAALTDEDLAVTIDVLTNDADVDADMLTVSGTSIPSNGTVVINGDNTITYTPNPNFFGADAFTYTVVDGNGGSDTATVNVTVNSINDAPVAVDDGAVTDEELAVTITVLANDSDVDGGTLSVSSTTPATSGTVVVNPDNTITYTPNLDFFGVDSFTYTVDDGQGANAVATVTVTVNNINDAPVAVDDIAVTDEDTAVSVTVLANDSDVDGDTLHVISASASSGLVVINGDNTITYTPNLDFNGADVISYTIGDSQVPELTASASVNVTVNAINDTPFVAVAIADVTMNEDDPNLVLDLSATFGDVDIATNGDSLTLSVQGVSNPALFDAVTVTGTNLTLDLALDQFGSATITVRATDTASAFVEDSFVVTVNPVNDAPVAVVDNVVVDEDSNITIDVVANDTDVDGDSLSASILTQPANGTVSMQGNKIRYVPDPDYFGPDSFTYTVDDGNGGTDTGTVNVTVNNVNDAPVAVADSGTTDEDTLLNIVVLANDTDVDPDVLFVSSASLPANGLVVILGNNTVNYTPNPDFNGVDTFTYTVSDGLATDVATVTVTVNPINDAPVAVDDNPSTNEEVAVTITVLANDSDVDGDPLSVASVGAATNGTVVQNPDDTITYTPDLNFNGVDSFTYTITDGALTAVATVSVNVLPVNDTPTPADDLVVTDEDVPVIVTVLANDTDIDGDALTVTATSVPTNGSVVINGGTTVTYTPNADWNGVDSFTYTVDDGNATAVATVTVTVNPVNDTPVAVDDGATTDEDTPVSVTVLANDSDVDGDTLSVISASASSGLVVINGDNTVTYTPNLDFNGADVISYTIGDGQVPELTASASVNVTVNAINDAPFVAVAIADVAMNEDDPNLVLDLSATFDDVDIATNGDSLTLSVQGVSNPALFDAVTMSGTNLTLDLALDQFGSATITVRATDTASAFEDAIFVVTVNPVNDPPVAMDDATVTDEELAVIVDVLANDSDVDGDALSVSAAGGASNGTVIVNGDNTITYTPNFDYFGADSFTYTVIDGNGGSDVATVSVTVNNINDAPVPMDDAVTTDEDVAIIIDVLADDSDVDGDALTVSAAGPATSGTVVVNGDNTVTYTPGLDFNGSDSFTYTVDDGNGGTASATVSVTITPVNDFPVAVNDADVVDEDGAVTIDVLANDSDVDGDMLSVSAAGGASNGSVVINGDNTITYTPNPDFNGADSFTYTANDGNGGTAVATVNITVNPINDAPVAVADNAVVDEDTNVVIDVLLNDTDVEGDTLSSAIATQPTNGTVSMQGKKIKYVPDPDYFGPDSFTYTVSDGNGGTDTGVVNVTVNNVNDAPVAADDSATTNEDVAVTIDVLTNDVDIDGDVLFVSSTTAPSNGSVVIEPDSTITYTPNLDFNGSDSFDYTANDGNGGTSVATVTVTINPVNDAPVAVDDSAITDEDNPVIVTVLPNDSDVEGDTLTITAVTQGANGSVVINGGLTVTYAPNPDYNGADTFTYTIADGNGGTGTATVSMTINPVNDVPVAVDDSDATNEDTPVVIAVLTNDSDIDGDALSVSGVSASVNGGVTVISGGGTTVTFSPAADFNGVDTFTYDISDGNGGFATATVTVTVIPVNDAPVAMDDSTSENEDTPVTFDVIANDTDIDGDALRVVGAPSSSNGSVVNNGDGTITYTPPLDFFGVATIDYVVGDQQVPELTDTGRLTVTVNPVNDPPVALDDNVVTDEEVPVTIVVLSNDTDPDPADVLTVQSVGSATNGNVVLNGDDTITYTGNLNYWGTDSFTYTIEDPLGEISTATVFLTINQVNDAPVAGPDSVTTDEDVAIVIDVLANDTDVDLDTLTISATTPPSNGSIVVNGDWTITYTPDPDFNGVDFFSYTADDGNGATDAAGVTLTINPVNDGPVAVADTANTPEDVPLTFEVVLNDYDVDGDPISTTGVVSATNGTVVDNGDGTVTFTPDLNYFGPASVTYEITDGVLNDSADLTITVDPVNDPPVAVDDMAVTDEDTPVVINVLANDTDLEGNPLNVLGTPTSPNGVVIVNPDDTLTFTPDPDFSGSTTIDYFVGDQQVPPGTDVGQVFVTVNPLNDAPVAVDDSEVTDEDTAVVVAVLVNDSDADGDTLTVIAASSVDGTATITGGGTTVTFDPNPDFNGVATVSYTIGDGQVPELTASASITITVNAVNDDPYVAAPLVDATFPEDEVNQTLDLAAVFDDVDIATNGDSLTLSIGANSNASLVAASISGTVLTLDFQPNQNGVATITVVATDSMGGTAIDSVDITVDPVNDPPYVVASIPDQNMNEDDPNLVIDLNGVFGDVDIATNGDVLLMDVKTVSNPALFDAVSVDASNVLTVDLALNAYGSAIITVSAEDLAGDTVNEIFQVIVASVNDAPVAVNDTAVTDEDVAAVIDWRANDSDVDGDVLAIVGALSATNGTVVDNGDGTVTYTPNAEFNGSDVIAYTAGDGQVPELTASAQIDITVNPVNDTPFVVAPIADVNMNEDDPNLLVPLAGTFDDVDIATNADSLTLSVSNVSNAALFDAVTVSGTDLTVDLAPDQYGSATITVRATDTGGAFAEDDFIVTVAPVNDAPVAVNDTAVTDEDTAVVIDWRANDSDVDGDPLAIINVLSASNGTVVDNGDGTVTYTPNAQFFGSDAIAYTIGDGQVPELTASAQIDITVNSVNDPPFVVAPIADANMTEDDPNLVIDLSATFDDLDIPTGDVLTLSVGGFTNAPLFDAVTIAGTDLTIDLAPNGYGSSSITVRATDTGGAFIEDTFLLDVAPVNDAPVAVDDTAVTDEDTAVVVNVVANDSDVDGDALAVLSASAVSGAVVNNGDGTVTYTPNLDFNGADVISYTIGDGQVPELTASASVNVTVNPVNDVPIAVDDTTTTDEDVAANITVLTNDTDVDGDTLTVTVTSAPTIGSAVVEVDQSVTYTPDPNVNGADSFTYMIDDGNGGTASATVSITVNAINDAPFLIGTIADVTMTEDVNKDISIAGVFDDVDIATNGDSLTFVVSANTNPTLFDATPIVGTTLTLDLALNQIGSATLTVRATDSGGAFVETTFNVDVLDTNDVPFVSTPIADQTVNEDAPNVVLDMSSNFDDPDIVTNGDSLTFTVVSGAANSMFTSVNMAGSTLTLDFAPDQNGSGDITIRATDSVGAWVEDTFTVTVNPVNDAPYDLIPVGSRPPCLITAYPLGCIITDEDVNVTADLSTYFGDVDIATNGDVLTYTVVSNNNAVLFDAVTITGDTITFDVAANLWGRALLKIRATDSAGAFFEDDFWVWVKSVNDAPFVSSPLADFSLLEDEPPLTLNIDNLFDDVDRTTWHCTAYTGTLCDTSEQDLRFLSIDGNSNPGMFDNLSVYYSFGYKMDIDLAADQNGSATITIGVTDKWGLTNSHTFTLTVTPVNDAPVAMNDSITTDEDVAVVIDVLANDSDVENDPLHVVGVPTATNGTVVVNGDATITYTPNADWNGSDVINYVVGDSQVPELTDAAIVNVTVTPVNDAPVAVDDVATMDEDTTIVIDVRANDYDVDGDTLRLVGTPTSPNGTASRVNFSRDVQFTPDPDFNGVTTITYTISDQQSPALTATATVTVTVNPVNDAPVVASPIANMDVNEDDPNPTVDLATVFDDVDIATNGDVLTYAVSANDNPALFDATPIAGGILTLDLAQDQWGTAWITVQATDGGGLQVTDQFRIIVRSVNDTPYVANAIADVNMSEDDPNLLIDISTTFDDIDIYTDHCTSYGFGGSCNNLVTDALTYSILSNSNPALFDAVTIGGTAVTLDLAQDQNGSADITVRATDKWGLAVDETFRVVVAPVNDTPFLVQPFNDVVVDEDATDTVLDLTLYFDDPDVATNSETLTYTVVNSNPAMFQTATISGTALLLDYGADKNGIATLTVRATDPYGVFAEDTFVVTVNPINDAPYLDQPIADVFMLEDDPNYVIDLAPVFDDVDLYNEGDSHTYTLVSNSNPGLFDAVTIDGALETLTLDLAADQFGSATITIKWEDAGGLSVEDTFTVVVDPVNDLPIANNDSYTFDEDTGNVMLDVLANDYLEDAPVKIVGAGVTVVIDGIVYTNATESVPTTQINRLGDSETAPNGSVFVESDTTLSYTPKENFTGVDFFTYTIQDVDGEISTGTVTITVNSLNDEPIGFPLTEYDVEENFFLNILAPGLLLGAIDYDGDPMTAVLQTMPTNGSLVFNPDGSFTYTPDVNFTGTDQFEYFISDGTTTNAGGPYVVALTVTPAPPPPPPLPDGDVEFDFQLSDLPLELATGTEPNVMVLMDDSGSMDWSMSNPEEREGRFRIKGPRTSTIFAYVHSLSTNTYCDECSNGRVLPSEEALAADNAFNGNQYGVWRARSHKYNKLYYNPEIQYLPWRGLDPNNQEFLDQDPKKAQLDPMDLNKTIDLTKEVDYLSDRVPRMNGSSSRKDVTVRDFYIPRYYATPASGPLLAWNDPHVLVEIRDPSSTYQGGPQRDDCAVDDGNPFTCTYAQEIQNFANWFSYYRSREYTAKNALGRVVAAASTIRLGYAAMNNKNDRIPIKDLNASFRAGNKRDLLDQIYSGVSNGSTPLRNGLDGIGKYYECVAGNIFNLPASAPGDPKCPVPPSPEGQCQLNYSLVFTDGRWNGGFNNTNIDGPGAGNTPFDGGMYADAIGGTLADVAMNYYERDLHPTLTDEVPTTARDAGGAPVGAFGADPDTMHQHMTTFGIQFGLKGNMTDADIPGDIAQSVAWGDPFNDYFAKTDDVRHMALNGRGAFMEATNTTELLATMKSAFDEFSTGEGSASAVSFNSQQIQEDNLIYRGFYNTKVNTGDLIAQSLDVDGYPIDPPIWSAATELDSKAPTDRVIVTFDTDPGSAFYWQGIPFRYVRLSPEQQATLSVDQVTYLRGDRSNERPLGANFRERPILEGLMGDIVNSTPVFVGPPNFNKRDRVEYPVDVGNLYSEFKSTWFARRQMVVVGANEGMLHILDGNTGEEIMAYVPDKLINGDPYANSLAQLTSPAYNHKFFVDLTPAIQDVFAKARTDTTREWRTVVVSGLRGGGKGYFAIDITDPSLLTTEANASDQVLWEFTDADDASPDPTQMDFEGKPIKDLGYTFSQPTLVMTNAEVGSSPVRKRWAAVFGNGYNSTAGVAKLFALFIEDGVDGWDYGAGDFVKVDTGAGAPGSGQINEGRPNGLGTPRLVDLDGNGTADMAYAGDMRGNLWRFDMNDVDPANWFATRVFTAEYPASPKDIPQPITTQPIVINNPQEDEGVIVIFGTGSFMTEPDATSTEIQSLYGIWDRFEASPNITRAKLVEQEVINLVDPTYGYVRTLTANPVTYSPPVVDRGWYMDLDAPRPLLDVNGDPNPDTSGNAPPDPQFPGERAVRNLQLRGGFVFINTVIPRDNSTCLQSPGGFQMAFNPVTGGLGGIRETIAFDFNNDGMFDDSDNAANGDVLAGMRFDDAVPTDSAFIGTRRYTQLSDKSISITRTNTASGPRTGRLSWEDL